MVKQNLQLSKLSTIYDFTYACTESITWGIKCLPLSWGPLFWMCLSHFPILHLYFCKKIISFPQRAEPFFLKHLPDSQLRTRYVKSKIQLNQAIFFTVSSWSRCFPLERDERGFRISLRWRELHLSSWEFLRKSLALVYRDTFWPQLLKYPPKAPYSSLKEHAAFPQMGK